MDHLSPKIMCIAGLKNIAVDMEGRHPLRGNLIRVILYLSADKNGIAWDNFEDGCNLGLNIR